MGIFNNNISYTSNTEYVSEGYDIINSIRKNPENVPLYLEEGTYYLAASDLVKYMESAELTDVEEALETIASHNCIESFDIELVDDSEKELSQVNESVNEYLTEAAVEDDAMDIKQAQKFYNKVLSRSKSAEGTKQELQERIKVLKECLKNMKVERQNVEEYKHKWGMTKGHVKYIAKSIIPFNSIYRLIKRQDVYAGLSAGMGGIAGLLGLDGGFAHFAGRAMGYAPMLDRYIEKTEEAIKFLEDKVKEMK